MARAASMWRLRHLLPLVTGSLCLLGTVPASAEPSDLFAPESVSAVADFRLVAANGEAAWSDGGFGKTRFGGPDHRDWKAAPIAAGGGLVWEPRLSWSP